MEELLKHKDDQGPIGDLARELIAILDDFVNGKITLEERNELINEVAKIYTEHDSADREIVARWAVNIVQVLGAVV